MKRVVELQKSAFLFLTVLALAVSTVPAHAKLRSYLNKPASWFQGDEARSVAANILSYQSAWGGWPKNTDTTANPYSGDPLELHPTFDNGATMDELRFLARMFNATGDVRYRTAFERGLDYTLVAQYPTGGWPQFYPPDDLYHREITFNDDAMVRVMEFIREVYTSEDYAFVAQERRDAARASFARGIDCILKCQVVVKGKPTVWCAQHDEEDYSPKPARSFELTTLSGEESVGITRLLMSLKPPSAAVARAVEAAVAWFQKVALHGIKVATVDDPQSPTGKDKRVVQDPSAPPLWARFYEIGTNKPIFSDRDGVAEYRLDQIGYERRNGYSWLGYYPAKLLQKDYPAWKAALPKQLPANASAPPVKMRIGLAGDLSVTDHEGWAFGFKKQLAAGTLCYDFSGANKLASAIAISDAQGARDVQQPARLPVKKRREYLSDAWWSKVVKTKPDYLLLQFRGNEVAEGNDGAKPADLLRKKIKTAVVMAKSAGIKPVLVTAPPGWVPDKDGTFQPKPSSNAEVIRKVAAEMRLPVVDLEKRCFEYLMQLGPEGVPQIFQIDPGVKPHRLTPFGQDAFGKLVAEGLREAVPQLQSSFRQPITVPEHNSKSPR